MNLLGSRNLRVVCQTFAIALFSLAFTAISVAAPGDIRITEVMHDANDDFVWEWIEVENTTGSPIDLDGYLAFNIGDGEFSPVNPTINSAQADNTIVPANSVAVIYDGQQAGFTGFPSFEVNDQSFRTAWNLDPNTAVIAAAFWPNISNANRSIGFWANETDWQNDLVDDDLDPNTPDVITSFATTQFNMNHSSGFISPPEGSSLVWSGNGSETNGSQWVPSQDGVNGATTSVLTQVAGLVNSTDDVGNPGVVPSGTPSVTGLMITEILYDPASSENDWEWIEIYNTGSAIDFSSTNYVIDDINTVAHDPNNPANITSGTIGTGQTGILYNADDITDPNTFLNAWGTGLNIIPVTNWDAMSLNNGGDTIGIWDDPNAYVGDHNVHANVVAQQVYDENNNFPSGSQGPSIYLLSLSADPNDGNNWGNADNIDGISFNATGVPGTGGLITFHGGGDIGSPGTIVTFTVENADFDGDGVVTGLDFLIYQQNIGATGQVDNSNGDANGDGVVNAADLASWEGQYGTSPISANVSAVPEPSTVLIAMIALAPLGLQRRRQS